MPPGAATPETYADLTFPKHGVDLVRSFTDQMTGTTPVGINVRTFEALTQRGRGGSRPGLSQYIPAQLPNGAHLIQHLNVVVDPTTAALPDNTDSTDPDAVEDPSDAGPPESWGLGLTTRNPGRQIRNGGWGFQPNKNRRRRITLVQATTKATGAFDLDSLAFASNVASGNVLIVGVLLSEGHAVGTVALSDSLGNTWTQAGSYGRMLDAVGGETAISLWYAVVSAAGACTVTATAAGALTPFVRVFGVSEWVGISTSSPLDSTSVATSGPGLANPTVFSTGNVAVNQTGSLLVGIFSNATNPPAGNTITVGSGFTSLYGSTSAQGEYKLRPSVGGVPLTASLPTKSTTVIAAIGASFKPQG